MLFYSRGCSIIDPGVGGNRNVKNTNLLLHICMPVLESSLMRCRNGRDYSWPTLTAPSIYLGDEADTCMKKAMDVWTQFIHQYRTGDWEGGVAVIHKGYMSLLMSSLSKMQPR